MPRQRIAREPVVINHIQNDNGYQRILEVATTNEQKLAEFQRILTDYEIIGKALDVEEIQSLDAKKVIAKKAIAAYEANQGNPILVEDTSLEMMGLDGRPGTYVKDFCGTRSMRQEIATLSGSVVKTAVLLHVYCSGCTTGNVSTSERA